MVGPGFKVSKNNTNPGGNDQETRKRISRVITETI